MTGTMCNLTAMLSTTQLAGHRPGFGWSSFSVNKPSRVTDAKLTAPAFHRSHAQGTAQNQYNELRCHSNKGQQTSVQQTGPTISRLDPALQQQWDHAANAHLGPIDITPKSGRKVWWTCEQCPDGHLHSWEATVQNRTTGRGCPQCCGRKVCKHNSLATKAPKVAAQWDYEHNANTPDNVVAQSSHRVGWLCEVCGEQWRQSPNVRLSSKSGCPQCARNAKRKKKIKHPTFAECQDPHIQAVLAEWDHERNALRRNFPHNTRLQSAKQIFWLCNKCPAGQQHSWSAAPYSRNGRGMSGCPFCAGHAACRCNSLQTLYPTIAAEWDQSMNQSQPSDHTASSHFVAWWIKPQRRSWQQSINNRTLWIYARGCKIERHPADAASGKGILI